MGNTTILGEHISLIRPSKIKDGRKRHRNLWVLKKPRTKTVKREVVLVAVAASKHIYTFLGSHKDLLRQYNLSPSQVEYFGWRLDDGSYVWKVN